MITIESILKSLIKRNEIIPTLESQMTYGGLSICLELLKKGYTLEDDLQKVFIGDVNFMPLNDIPTKI